MRIVTLLKQLAAAAVFLCGAVSAVGAVELSADEVRDKVFVSVQNGLSSQAGQALVQAGARIAAGSEELAALLRERQDIVESMQPMTEALSGILQSTGIESEEQAAAIETEIAAARDRIVDLDVQLAEEFPEFKELTNPSALNTSEVQALLGPDEALIMTLTDESHVYVWAISKTTADWARADIGAHGLSDKIKLLRSMLSLSPDTRSAEALDDGFVSSVAPFDLVLAHELYSMLLAPLEHVFGGADHLMTVADGPLTSLPFSVFVSRAPMQSDLTDPEAMRQAEWLIKRFALTTLPTVSSLKVLRRRKPAKVIKGDAVPFMGFGNPKLGYQLADGGEVEGQTDGFVHSRGIYDNITRVADLSPLPNTSRELRALAQAMGADDSSIFLAEAATESAVKSADMSGVEVIAFATHGLLTGGLPGLEEPALVFTPPDHPSAEDDALLMASEAAQLNLSADLIILSACDTAGSDGTPGAEGLSGLARSFIYAGARSILVSHWPVDDYAASELTTEMLRGMYGTEKLATAKALQVSILNLMNDDSDDRFVHPSIWAPFVVVGEGG